MPEEVVDQPVVDEPVVTDDPVVQETTEEAVTTDPVVEPEKPHPLEPGGERFKQVYARAKEAEERLQREREERIRLEERVKIQEQHKTTEKPEHVYSWEELETFITNGQVTRAQANEYRERKLQEKWEREKKDAIREYTTVNTVQSRLVQDIDTYRQHLPDVDRPGTEAHTKVLTEYQDLVSWFGAPKDQAEDLKLQREALIRAFGKPNQLASRPKPQPKQDPMQDTISNGRPSSTSKDKANDPVAKLDARQRAHYEHMIKRGHYRDWSEVREELSFVPGPKKRK